MDKSEFFEAAKAATQLLEGLDRLATAAHDVGLTGLSDKITIKVDLLVEAVQTMTGAHVEFINDMAN